MNGNSSLNYSEYSLSTALYISDELFTETPISPFISLNYIQNPINNNYELMFLSDLQSKRFRLIKPLSLLLIKKNNEYILEFPSLELYAYGENKDEVILEFKEELLDLSETLFEEYDTNLGKFPKIWKTILSTIIIDEKY
jgi:hypothetical protein